GKRRLPASRGCTARARSNDARGRWALRYYAPTRRVTQHATCRSGSSFECIDAGRNVPVAGVDSKDELEALERTIRLPRQRVGHAEVIAQGDLLVSRQVRDCKTRLTPANGRAGHPFLDETGAQQSAALNELARKSSLIQAGDCSLELAGRFVQEAH